MREAGALLEKQLQAAEAERHRLEAERRQAPARAASPPPRALAAGTRLKAPTLSVFTGAMGFEVDSWLRSLRKQFEFHGEGMFPNDAERIQYATFYLEGAALTWWDSVDKSGVETWDDFVKLLHKRWQPRLAAEVARQKIAALKQRGTVSQLCNALQQLLAHVPTMHEDDRIFHFKQALSASIAAKVAEQKPSTLEEAMQVAVQAELYVGRPSSSFSGGLFYRPSNASSSGGARHGSSSATPMELSNLNQAPAEQTDDTELESEAPTQEQLLALWKEANSHGKEQALNAMLSRARIGKSVAKVPGISKGDYERCRKEGRCLRCKEVTDHIARDCKKPIRLNF